MKLFFKRQFWIVVVCLFCGVKVQGSENLSSDQAREKMLSLLSGEWISRGVYVATKLEVADLLQDGPKSIAEIASSCGANPDSLQRILHMLVGYGVFEEPQSGVFMNNEASLLLSKSAKDSLHSLSTFYGEEIHTAWDQLLPSVRAGSPAFQASFKQPVFAYFKENPPRAALFQAAMKEKSGAVIQSALAAYNFGQFQTIYDIGAGYGQFLSAILAKHSDTKAVAFDLPEVVNATPKSTNKRLKLQSGDFFVSVPKGGDAYLLKSVLHDWNDEQAESILKNCHDAMDAKSKLLIVETVLLPKDGSLYANCMDVLMLAVTGGKERSLASFEKMLANTGFVLEKVHPTSTEFSILEARKK